MTNKRFHYIEDASGVYSKWKNLDRILSEKDKGMAIMCRHYNAYGKSRLYPAFLVNKKLYESIITYFSTKYTKL